MNFKKLVTFLLVFFVLLSCSSDEGNSNTTSDIVGTWKLTSLNIGTAIDLNNDGVSSTNIMSETNCYLSEVIIFNSNNSGVFNNNSYANISALLLIGTNQYEYDVNCILESEAISFNWSENGNALSLTDNDGENYILSVNNSQIIFIMLNGFKVLDEGSSDVIVEENLILTYTKQ